MLQMHSSTPLFIRSFVPGSFFHPSTHPPILNSTHSHVHPHVHPPGRPFTIRMGRAKSGSTNGGMDRDGRRGELLPPPDRIRDRNPSDMKKQFSAITGTTTGHSPLSFLFLLSHFSFLLPPSFDGLDQLLLACMRLGP